MANILKLFIGVIQLVGGALLIYALYVRFTEVGTVNLFTVIIPLLLFTCLCFYAGIEILRGKLIGIKLSILNFALQLFQFSYFGIYFYYFIGPYVSLGYQKPLNSSLKFWTDYEYFTGTLIVYIREDKSSHFLLLNLVALIILILLIYLKSTFKKSKF